MRLVRTLLSGSGFIALAIAAHGAASAQKRVVKSPPPTVIDADSATNEDLPKTDSDVVVVGVRQSIEDAVKRKRTSRNVVDSIVAEDAGKLPDNNVPEAIARVPGVNISRSQGQGGEVTIRGLQGVQTTVNGNDVAVGQGRALSLSDIPAELIKSIDVYKSRDASQPEGGAGGTVNIELRRPLDLKRGLTAAASLRGLYDDRTEKVAPYGSLLLGGNFDTGIGEWGFLINGSYTKNLWQEAFITNESPGTLVGNAQGALPAANRDSAVAPFRIQTGLDSGRRTQRALTGTLQWKPGSDLSFVLEGQYFGSRSVSRFDSLDLQTREGDPIPSNVTFLPSGAIRSYTLSRVPRPADPDNPDSVAEVLGPQSSLPGGVFANQSRGTEKTYIGNFEAHWNPSAVRIDFSAQYNRNRSDSYAVRAYQRFLNATRAEVDFASPTIPGGGPRFDFVGVDETDPRQLTIGSFTDEESRFKGDIYVAKLDIEVDVHPTNILRSFKFGSRYQLTDNIRNYGYRDVFFGEGSRPSPDALRIGTRVVNSGLRGVDNLSWASINTDDLYDQWADIRGRLLAVPPSGVGGPGSDRPIAEFLAADRPFAGRGQEYVNRENIFAAYAIANIGFNIGFPVDGFAGVRYVNTWGAATGTRYDLLPRLDDAGAPIPNSCCREILVDETASGNFVDILPSAALNFHVRPNIQLRTTYNLNVQRPDFFALRNFVIVNQTNASDNVFAGNPDLKPFRDHNFNAVLEWYPRTGSSVTLGAFYKRQSGFFYDTARIEPVPQLGGLTRRVLKTRNAGPGEVLGFESALTSQFFFLPGILANFGVSLNGTYIPRAILEVPNEDETRFTKTDASFTSRYSTNAILFYESRKFSTRLAYNWRSSFKTSIDAVEPGWIQEARPTQRLDAAINYTPYPFVTVSLEGTNLIHNTDRFRYFKYPDLPVGLRQMGRTVQASIRVRY